MSYPLIVLGAGASHDFLKIERYGKKIPSLMEWKPPVTKDIFDVSRFLPIIENYDDVKPLASIVTNISENKEKPFNLEDFLSDQETRFPEKSLPQIIALRFYLAELFSKISLFFYKDVNNHRHLIDEINKLSGKAVVVNFNYDTLFESNLKEINIANNYSIDKYVSGDIKVIKIHGAHNWRYTPEIDLERKNPYSFFVNGGMDLYNKYKDHEIHPTIVNNTNNNDGRFILDAYREHQETHFLGGRWAYYLPAVAVPIASKAEYVCPKSHIELLKSLLPSIDRILIIGWSAQDNYLLDLLKEGLSKKTKLTIVSSTESSGIKVASQFKKIKQIYKEDITIDKNGGYTNFMTKEGYKDFFK